MDDNLYRVESAACAVASGNMTYGQWAFDMNTALGFAGQRNPLGFAMTRYLGETPSAAGALEVVMTLTTVMIRKGLEAGVARDASWKAFEFWRAIRCSSCHGHGRVGPAQAVCSPCGGSGQRRMPDGPAALRDAISAMIEAEQWMERMLRARLKSSEWSSADGCRVNLPMKSIQDDHGFNHSARTPARRSVDTGG